MPFCWFCHEAAQLMLRRCFLMLYNVFCFRFHFPEKFSLSPKLTLDPKHNQLGNRTFACFGCYLYYCYSEDTLQGGDPGGIPFCVVLWFLLHGIRIMSSFASCSHFSVPWSIAITVLNVERAGLYASRACVCLSCMRCFMSFSLPLGVFGWLRLVIVALLWLSI